MFYENKKTKTIVCSFWERGICRYMVDYDKCSYSHGVEDLEIKVECKYGSKCDRANCKYNHGNFLSQDINNVYEVPIRIKKKNKKNNYVQNDNTKIHNIKNNLNKNNKQIILINDKKIDYKISTIIQNNNGISIGIQTDNIEPVMNIKLNENFNKKNKLEKIYKKWENIYNIFKKYNYNYKLIKENISQIRVYIKDKNIYKVKERAIKIYKYYSNLKINKDIDFLTISNILKMKI